jgi:DNA-directed RNA polymerase subunit N (RpoN/RPB10)
MSIIQSVRCPNCGKLAERLYLPLLTQVQTQCGACDYLLISCTRTGKVIEAYYPGLNYQKLSESSEQPNSSSLRGISKLLKIPVSKLLPTTFAKS